MRVLLLLLLAVPLTFAAEDLPKTNLEIRLVLEEKTPEALEYKFVLPGTEQKAEILFLSKETLLPAAPVIGAVAGMNEQVGVHQVLITLTEEAAKKMGDFSRKYLKRRIAIIVEGKVINVPVIQGEITGKEILLVAPFSEKEAQDLAMRIHPGVKKPRP